MKKHLLAGMLSILALPTAAAEVTSAHPDHTVATLYQSFRGMPDVAMISETRSVELPAGDNVIIFADVASTLIPQTAQVSGLPTPPSQANFDYALFDPATILDKSVGTPAELIQSPSKGPETRRTGRLLSQQGIIAFEDENGVQTIGCGGPPARLVVGIPPGLRSKPSLSVQVRTEKAGRHVLRLSYLADNIRWRAVYVAKIARNSRHLDLEGRIALENGSATSFDNTPTRFVVGNVPRLWSTRSPHLFAYLPQRDCWDLGRTSDPVVDDPRERKMLVEESFTETVSAAGAAAPAAPAAAAAASVRPPGRVVEQEELGDLKMFRLEEPVRIAAKQQKLFTFLSAPAVKTEPFFIVPYVDNQPIVDGHTRRAWRLSNTKAAGLGRPLPQGSVTLYQGGTGFLGDDTIADGVAEGGSLNLTGDPSDDVLFDHRVVAERSDKAHEHTRDHALSLANQTDRTVTVELHWPRNRVKAVVAERGKIEANSNAFVWRTQLRPHQRRDITLTATLHY
ncbi:MAG: DUF4139 domain-containing protein [Bacteroidota bacterium]